MISRAVADGLHRAAGWPRMASHFMASRRQLQEIAHGPALDEGDRLLVVAPHCDDETLGVGGTLAAARARGLAVRVVFVTNGDGSRSTQIGEVVRRLRFSLRRFSRLRSSLRRFPFSSSARCGFVWRGPSFAQLAAMRQREAVQALRRLGVAESDIVFLGYPDGGLQAMWQRHWLPAKPFRSPTTKACRSPYANSLSPGAPYCGQQALADVTRALQEFRPTHVFTTHPNDTHSDHRAAYALTRAALQALARSTAPSTATWAQHAQLLTFPVHHGVWPWPHGYHPRAALRPPAALRQTGTRWMQTVLDAPSRSAKKAALDCYGSQMTFTPHYLRGFLRRNELFGTLDSAEC